jgi:hypothetical protein
MSRGIGGALIHHLRAAASAAGVRLQAEFKHTPVNRMMYMTYKFTHFREIASGDELVMLENDLTQPPAIPGYLRLVAP